MELKNFFAQDDAGNILSSATCYLYERGTESLVEVLQGANGLPLSNPFVSDQKGLVQFAAPNGLYDLRVVKGNRDSRLRMQCNDVMETAAAAENAARVIQQKLLDTSSASSGAGMVLTKAPLALAIERRVSEKLGERISLLDLVPPGTDLWNTDLTPWVQYGVNAYGVLDPTKNNLRIEGPVYVRSDRGIPGMGSHWGGTVIRKSTPGPVFIGGKPGDPVHTRVKITGIKFVCDNVPDRTGFTMSFMNGFMNEFSDLSFGDISGSGNQQNGLAISGTAHWVTDIRGIGLQQEVGLEAETGILMKSFHGTNKYKNIQHETGSRIIFEGERNSSIYGLHGERSSIVLINSSWNVFSGGYFIDGTVSLDERSACNRFDNIGGANARLSDLGMFNDYNYCPWSIASHGALRYGLSDSYLKESVVATAWDSPVHKAYKLPATGWYVAIVLCKNTFKNGSSSDVQSGTVEVYNVTTGAVLASKTYSIINNSGIVGSQAQSGNATQTVILCFQGALNDQVVVRDRAGVIKVFMSPVENVNPMMLGGSAWGVAGAPGLPGESYWASPVSITPVYTGGKFIMPVSGMTNFGLTQFFKPRTAAELYGVIIKGSWLPGALRVSPYSGNDGARSGSVSQRSDALAEDGSRYLIQYIDGRALSSTEGVTRIAIGSTLVPSAQNIAIEMIAVFPIR